jgi:hypothetical protein
MKGQFVANVVCLAIERHQMFTHHHVVWVKEVTEAYYQVHNFNDDGH